MQNLLAGLKVSHRILLVLPVLSAVVILFIGLDLNRTKRDIMEGRERALRSVIESAVTVVGSFYERERSKQLTHEQAQEQAKEALRALSFDEGEGRIFSYDFSGLTTVSVAREVEGTNRIAIPNVRENIAIAKAGGGFNGYKQALGPRTGDQRLAYLAPFTPWEWAIGTSVFVSDVDAIFWRVALMQVGVGVLALLTSCAVVLLIARSISQPIAQITVSMGSLAGGDLDVVVPFIGQRNEFGRLGWAIQVFKDNALAIRDLRAQQEASRAAAELERSRIEAERAREAAEDQVAIGALAQGLGALASGDLTHHIAEDFVPKTQQLKTDFNATASQLRTTMADVAGAIDVMTQGTKEISRAADDLSRRTEQQAASLEETAAALDQITAAVRKTAKGAIHVQDVVSAAQADAQRSNQIVQDAVLAMGEIDKSSRQVSQIIGVIDEIAFQTNLLALNAGVEAARAGDAGRGFAVVASEVRGLAQRSAEAAKEIKALIAASATYVGRGVKLVDETGQSLQRIVSHVVAANAAVSEIAASAKEQASGLDEVNTAVNQMDQVTQQNAAMVEQSTAASYSLAQETEALKRLTGYFRTEMQPSTTRSWSPASRIVQPIAV